MTASPEVVSYQRKQLFEVSGCSDCYLRLNPELHNASTEMDNVLKDNIKNLKDAGERYVAQNREKLDKIVDNLIFIQQTNNFTVNSHTNH